MIVYELEVVNVCNQVVFIGKLEKSRNVNPCAICHTYQTYVCLPFRALI